MRNEIKSHDSTQTKEMLKLLDDSELDQVSGGAIYWPHDGIKGNFTSSTTTTTTSYFGTR